MNITKIAWPSKDEATSTDDNIDSYDRKNSELTQQHPTGIVQPSKHGTL